MFPSFSPLNERVRAQLENQQLEKAATLRTQYNRPVHPFRIKLWRHPVSQRMQHTLK